MNVSFKTNTVELQPYPLCGYALSELAHIFGIIIIIIVHVKEMVAYGMQC